jgi:hypothetical protein
MLRPLRMGFNSPLPRGEVYPPQAGAGVREKLGRGKPRPYGLGGLGDLGGEMEWRDAIPPYETVRREIPARGLPASPRLRRTRKPTLHTGGQAASGTGRGKPRPYGKTCGEA